MEVEMYTQLIYSRITNLINLIVTTTETVGKRRKRAVTILLVTEVKI